MKQDTFLLTGTEIEKKKEIPKPPEIKKPEPPVIKRPIHSDSDNESEDDDGRVIQII